MKMLQQTIVKDLKRVDALRKLACDKKGFDGFLVTNPTNLLYFAGFPGTSCMLVPNDGTPTIYVYGVNYEQAKEEGRGFTVDLIRRGEDVASKIAKHIKTLGLKNIAIDSITGVCSRAQADYLQLSKPLRGSAKIKIKGELVTQLRKVKGEEEIQLIRKACELTGKGMAVAYETIKPGVKECEVAAEIEYVMRKNGSWGTGFETSVASGVRSAFPHGGCTEQRISKGDLVVIDIGATYKHYCSDMTRTVTAGNPTSKQKKIYEIVRRAQEEALEALKTGVKAKEVDLISRKTIEDAGYGGEYVHGLGHGLGLQVHEPPTLNPTSKDTLIAGNVVTVEPGIYIIGFGGFRIEDTALVQKQKAERLTSGPYTLETQR